MAHSFGMMNEAYFVGKGVLIDWVNTFLSVRIEKVEDMATASCYCNIWDALHPGTLPMSKIDFTVKHDYEYAANWKLLQNGFLKMKIDKPIPVERLIKARYQDNLEFLQWFYKYAHDVYNGDPDNPEYDACSRRSRSKGGKNFSGRPGGVIAKRGSTSSNSGAARGNMRRGGGKENRGLSNRPTSARNSGIPKPVSHRGAASAASKTNSSVNAAKAAESQRALEQLRQENAELRDSVQSLQASESKLTQLQAEHLQLSNVAKDIEKERDFYFGKVLEVEKITKEFETNEAYKELIDSILNVLYQTSEDMGDDAEQPQQDEEQDNSGAVEEAQPMEQDNMFVVEETGAEPMVIGGDS